MANSLINPCTSLLSFSEVSLIRFTIRSINALFDFVISSAVTSASSAKSRVGASVKIKRFVNSGNLSSTYALAVV